MASAPQATEMVASSSVDNEGEEEEEEEEEGEEQKQACGGQRHGDNFFTQNGSASAPPGHPNWVLRAHFGAHAIINPDASADPDGYNPATQPELGANAVVTYKYTAWSWIPKSMFEQFRRIANVYFLGISILMLIGTYAPSLFQTPLEPWSTLVTLVIVMLITSVKEGVEDVERHKADAVENTRPVTVLRTVADTVQEVEVECQNVRVGDIVRVPNNMLLPADMIILQTALHEDANQCYIETSNIDGETNLKVKQAPMQLRTVAESMGGTFQPSLFARCELEAEPPNKSIHSFAGSLRMQPGRRPSGVATSQAAINAMAAGQDAGGNPRDSASITNTPNDVEFAVGAPKVDDVIPLSEDNFVLRGSVMQNTKWMYGFVVYCGPDSKIMKNSRDAPSKLSTLEIYVNTAIKIIFIAQVVLVTISVICGVIIDPDLPYVYPPDDDDDDSVLPDWLANWFVFFLLYNNLIPISLYVTIELVNVGQSYLIGQDIRMYDKDHDCPCVVRASNLCQEIGMVTHIFSDKTGTLTRNEMKFVRYAVDGVVRGIPESSNPGPPISLPPGPKGSQTPTPTGATSMAPSAAAMAAFTPPRSDKEVGDAVQGFSQSDHDFLEAIAVCHTVVLDSDGYRAESPDELALLTGVKRLGYVMNWRSMGEIRVDVMGEDRVYRVLATNQFDSTRKRMSVLVEDANGRRMLFCKGADTVVLPRCRFSADGTDSETTENMLTDFAMDGLRTLVVASRELSREEADAWLESFAAAAASVNDRAKKLTIAANEIERNMRLLGITGVEDRLQEGVPETIEMLERAGITVWMLTGDKRETAVNIAFSCHLLRRDMTKLRVVGCKSVEHVRSQLERCLRIAKGEAREQDFRRSSLFAQDSDLEAALNRASSSRSASSSGDRSEGRHASKPNARAVSPEPKTSGTKANDPLADPLDDDSYHPNDEEASRLGNSYAVVVDGPSLTFAQVDAIAGDLLFELTSICSSVVACRVSPSQKAHLVRLVKHRGRIPPPKKTKKQSKAPPPTAAGGIPDRSNLATARLTPRLTPRSLSGTGSSRKQPLNKNDSSRSIGSHVSDEDYVGSQREDTRTWWQKVDDSIHRPITLAIGDGANDVGMIQESHVGIGIVGWEGRQAANVADFAISQFRFLQLLLVVHGRWNYVRQSYVFLYSMHKNMVLTLTLFWYSYYTALSGTSMYEALVYTAFNFALGLPIIFFGILDKDLSAEFAVKHPQCYVTGRRNTRLDLKEIGFWIANGCAYASMLCLLFFVCVNFFNYSLYQMGTMFYTGMILALQWKIAFMTNYWTWINWFVLGLSIAGYFGFIYVYSFSEFLLGIAQHLYADPIFWLAGVLFIPMACVLIDVVLSTLRSAFFPDPITVLREKDRDAAKSPLLLLMGNGSCGRSGGAPASPQSGGETS